VDFWPQHKDFVLRLVAGLAVFLVALIARGIYFGDDLEKAQHDNVRLASEIRNLKVMPQAMIRQLNDRAQRLQVNATAILGEIGWDSANDDLVLDLIRRTLGRLDRFRDGDEARLQAEATTARADINANLNGGFGQLRLTVRDSLRDEAAEKGIQIEAGTGLENVLAVESMEDLPHYLMLLELSARLARYAIDARIDSIDEMRLVAGRESEVAIPDANPEFLSEYALQIVFQGSEASLADVLNRLAAERPVVPIRELLVTRVERPLGHVRVELTVLAVVGDASVPFVAEHEEQGQ